MKKNQPKLLIFGANGQVGGALNMLAEGDVVALGRGEADLSKPETLRRVIADIRPDAIINAAAYTAVDKAEEEEALATLINADAPGVMAEEAAKRGIPFVHYSTDYVFDGSGERPWKEDDNTAPLNAYGRSKLAGEQAVLAAGGNAFIFRISWVYDATGKNFLTTMLRLAKDREVLKVVADQFGAPCYAPHLARATLDVLAAEGAPGIYHMANAGETSWHCFATEIFAEARKKGVDLAVKEVLPIPASDYPTPAKRPTNSRLDCTKLHDIFGLSLPDWREGLKEAIAQI